MKTNPINYSVSDNIAFCNQALPLWSNRKYAHDRFYQSGYEIIRIDGDRNMAIQTLLASLTWWDEEIIICGNQVIRDEVKDLAKGLGIVCQPFFEYPDDPAVLSNILEARPAISHMVLNITSDFIFSEEYISTIVWLKEIYRLKLIVNCRTNIAGISELFRGNIDFLIGETIQSANFVIARRNLLVQIEGNSRSRQLDLYNLWQKQVLTRKALIEPMDLCEV